MFGLWKKRYLAQNSYLSDREKYILELEKKVGDLEKIKNVNSTIPRVVYDKFKKSLPNSMVGDDSTAGAIGYKLGVAHVLMRMEEDLVV